MVGPYKAGTECWPLVRPQLPAFGDPFKGVAPASAPLAPSRPMRRRGNARGTRVDGRCAPRRGARSSVGQPVALLSKTACDERA